MQKKKLSGVEESFLKNFIGKESEGTPTLMETDDPSVPIVQSENLTAISELNLKNTNEEPIISKGRPKLEPQQEKRAQITFQLPIELDKKLIQFLFSQKIAGAKITKTQIIIDAIEKYLDENNM